MSHCLIVPPQILRRLLDSDEPAVVRAAERTLAVSGAIVGRRSVRSSGLTGSPGAGNAGLIPQDLRHRAESAQERELPSTARDRKRARQSAAAASYSPKRTIFDAKNGTDLPGTKVRDEGQPAVADESVNEAYDGLGDTFALYAQVYDRDSLDGKGLPLLATVHYDKDFDNAYWDGEQMVFGDGDGVYFRSFTDSVDVIGHELTHGFTQYTAGFTYVAQSGALNESVSDCFGSMVKQRVNKQSAADADWLIGQGLFTEKVKGVALRSMKAPGTAYDDPHLGKDPQPADMDGYQDLPHDEQNDNGGVHVNSGIPNRAFYLAATGIGGNSWEGAGRIWYDVMTAGNLPKDVDFKGFAEATIKSAGSIFGAGGKEEQAVQQAWVTVKVLTG
ncbi:M4 family metallopeptidase [Flexivirga sp. ID2601S]|uniref:Neutral metalloproteinase n=1 Tax=Flexivirga aerilata TaxID=1656889 RepID=A0A849AL16_9MICO|nr:M4 family metallopeptidase [Flexivirga aerilata]NNG40497.1 M4 family metallopeptidase [Flexivirga aerilata]